jgi:hypothetical protein
MAKPAAQCAQERGVSVRHSCTLVRHFVSWVECLVAPEVPGPARHVAAEVGLTAAPDPGFLRPIDELPDIAAVVGALLARVPREEQPLLIALAERLAAERYRSWAREAADAARTGLLACAEREEEIARRVEALYPNAPAAERDLVARNPDLIVVNRSLFAGRSLDDQLRLQARGERLGATTWRSLARAADPAARDTFLACALLEEESAAFLESILA